MNFRSVASVNFQGLVVAFARGDEPSPDTDESLLPTNIHFNVLALNVDSQSDANDWSGFRHLSLPDAVRPAGMNMINVPVTYTPDAAIDGLQDANQPFRILTNQEYIYIFRQAKKGTLLVNRLRLVRETAQANSQEVIYALQPAWEVRYQRSGKPDSPADMRDSQAYLSPDKTPFYEPAFELFMIEGLVDGNFDVQFLPRADGTLLSCSVFVTNAATNSIDVYELPLDSFGQFSLVDKTFVSGNIPPDFSFKLQDDAGAELTLSGSPAAVFYLKQERMRSNDNKDFTVKRSGRLLLAQNAALGANPKTLATLDFAVAGDGTMARPDASLIVKPVGTANYTMDFDASAYIGFPDWAPKQHYSIDLWIYPKSLDLPSQQIIGPMDQVDAPYLRLIDGTAIEVGFMGKNGKPFSARTASGTVRQKAWTRVQVSFDAAATPKYSIKLNGFDTVCTFDGDGDHPTPGFINAVSAPNNGFIGCVDQFLAYDGANWDPATIVGEFSFDTIDYLDNNQQPLNPPHTPNKKDTNAPGLVYGAHLIPSTSPAVVASGSLTWDSRGLSIYASYFEDLQEYSELNSSPFLLSGSDGLLHCYFKGASDAFSVMQLDTETARSVFEGTWNTAAGTAESGRLQIVATQAGAFMNNATVSIKPTPSAEHADMFCDVTMVSPSGVTETWCGVPRSLQPFTNVLAGNSVSDPADPRLLTGSKYFFDNTGKRTSAYLPLAGSPNKAAIALVSRARLRLPLASVKVDDDGQDCNLKLTFTAIRWPGDSVTAIWKKLPKKVDAFINTLSGLSTAYEYKSTSALNVASYSIAAASNLVAANRVVLFVKAQSGDMQSIAISTCDDKDKCNVTIKLGSLNATWTNVPRAQVDFALVIEGAATSKQYDYATLASGDYKALGDKLIISTDGSEAMVLDVSLGGGAPVVPDDDLRVSASLFATFTTDSYDSAAVVPTAGTEIAASNFQSAIESVTGTVVENGSTLFRAMPFSLPTQGAVGLVAHTEALTGGVAPLTLQGFNGGWLNQPEQRALTYAWNDYVSFETDEKIAPNIGALTIKGDMSLELWCRPERASQDMLQPFQRLLTFSCPPAGSADAVQYMAALSDAPSLACAANTRVRTSINTSIGTFYTWFSPQTASGTGSVPGIIGSVCTIGVNNPILTLAIDANSHISLSFALDTTQAPIVSSSAVLVDTWHQTGICFKMTYKVSGSKINYTFDVELYVDGVSQGIKQYTTQRNIDDEIMMATMVIGDIVGTAGLPMLINETALFTRILSPDDFEGFFEQRIPDNTDELVAKWMFLEGKGDRAINSAVTGAVYDADITPGGIWAEYGLYSRPVLGHGNNVAVLADNPVIHGWTHLALVHQAGFAVGLRGRDFGDCGNDNSLNLGESFSVEAWTQLDPPAGTSAQILVAKGQEYILGLDSNRRPFFSVRVSIADVKQTLTVTSSSAINIGQAAYLAARYEVATVVVAGSGQAQEIRYEAHLSLYVNGKLAVWGIKDTGDSKVYLKYKDPVERVYSTAPLNLGRSPEAQGSSYLRGSLADVRLWSRLLSDEEIKGVYESRRAPLNSDGMISWWRFNEEGGRIAFDAKGDNNATLSNGNLRKLFATIATNSFYVNGGPAAKLQFLDSPDAIGGYGNKTQFLFSQVIGALPTGFYGQLADVRIWNTQLTQEQIADSMFRPPSGSEPNLRGYWNFGNGSGPVVEDRTGRGNTGKLVTAGSVLPQWKVSTAPLSNESAEVLNIFGGVSTFAQRDISERPSVIEYADLQRDAYGNPISVMKRCYISVHDSQINLLTGYKVGDLDTVYLGQAQSKPTLIGYIEGAPPIPSENQTLPYWLGGYGESNTYAGAAEVKFSEADNTVYAYNASRDTSDTHAFTMKGGLYGGGQYETSAGIGFEVTTPMVVFEGHLGAQGGFQLTDHKSDGIGVQSGTNTNFATGLKPAGAWEPGTKPQDWVNPVVGRRYVPNNNGVALVKSLTVDVYASILRDTGSMVKISMAPNPDIPEDVNLIDFPIDPTYIKNGTLDGKVGLRNDPNYPDADLQRGSYFKPLEAYALKRRIEHEETALEAYYQQYDASSYSTKLKSASNYTDYQNTIRNNGSYDWSQHLSKRSIANTYVWTAGGGSFAEQSQPMNVYSEQHGAISSTQWSIGAVGDIQMAFPVVGFYLDFDYLYSSATEVNVVKSKEEGASFDLAAQATPDSYLYAPTIVGSDVTFPNSPTEGKVDGYRYMAFMLAPKPDNGDMFFSKVVDPNWLANSKDANAAALREARSAAAGPWRVLYRVTYVSRIPPKFQPVPAETQSPDIRPPANLVYNASLIQLVKSQITSLTPTSLEIGTAISAVIGTPGAPGLLKTSLPWWPEFLLDSTDYTLSAATILRELREDLLQYMIALYAAKPGA